MCLKRPPSPHVSLILVPFILSKGPGASHIFKFDHAFSSESTQQEVFGRASELVQSVMDGYRVCIFSYGQTGSGKTHTMTGDFEVSIIYALLLSCVLVYMCLCRTLHH